MKFMNSENAPNAFNSPNFLFNDVGRIRSGWRFLIFQVLFVIFAGALGETINLALRQMSIVYEPGSVLSFVVQNLILLVPALLLGWLCGRVLEGLPFRALGASFASGWFKDLIFGLIVGAASISLAVLIAVAFGGMRLEINQSAGAAAIILTASVSLFVFTIGAAAEEAYFRGYILQTFARAHLVWVAILITALFFGSAHLNNPNATKLSTLNTILAGVWLVVAYLKTRNLWFAFGMHLTWNWLQGAFFGISVSGITSLTTAPFLVQSEKGNALVSGGDYGIEGGIACTVAIIVSGVFVYFSPLFKPNKEMLELTSRENAAVKSTSPQS